MPSTTEPGIVTHAKMDEHLRSQVAKAEKALADAQAAVDLAALDDERGSSPETLRKLSKAEERRDKRAAELRQLGEARRALDTQLAHERQAAEAQAKRDTLADYGKHRDAVRDRNLAVVAAFENVAADIEQARKDARAADALGRSLGFAPEGHGRGLWPEVGALKNLLNGLLTGQPRVVRDARQRIERDWRTTPNGRRAVALLAALGDADATE